MMMIAGGADKKYTLTLRMHGFYDQLLEKNQLPEKNTRSKVADAPRLASFVLCATMSSSRFITNAHRVTRSFISCCNSFFLSDIIAFVAAVEIHSEALPCKALIK